MMRQLHSSVELLDEIITGIRNPFPARAPRFECMIPSLEPRTEVLKCISSHIDLLSGLFGTLGGADLTNNLILRDHLHQIVQPEH